MRDRTVTLSVDPGQPMTLASVYDQLCAMRRRREEPEEIEVTPKQWAELLASPEVARACRYPSAGPETLMGLPIRFVDNAPPVALRSDHDPGPFWPSERAECAHLLALLGVRAPVDNRVHRGEGDGRVQERQGGLSDREGGQADRGQHPAARPGPPRR